MNDPDETVARIRAERAELEDEIVEWAGDCGPVYGRETARAFNLSDGMAGQLLRKIERDGRLVSTIEDETAYSHRIRWFRCP